jgi:hypothetical protein|nr:MAG TPA: hypothetical protein [Caudoviricetes sp.]
MNKYLFKIADLLLATESTTFKNIQGASGTTYNIEVIRTPTDVEVWSIAPTETIYTEFDAIMAAYEEQEYLRRKRLQQKKKNKVSILNILFGRRVA